LLLPAAAIAAQNTPRISSHGLAVGVGALVWGLVLETATLRDRTARLSGAFLLSTPNWIWALLLCAVDVLALGLAARFDFGSADLDVAMTGVAYVAAADLVSTYIGFMLGSPYSYPLSDP
jgi:ABC-type dipeptide/oligopeptide/nickel transport system permease component